MSDSAADNYAIYYSDKLWNLLPAIYRTLDTDQFNANGPLREIVNRIGGTAADLRRSIDRLWEDQSIETCDDWAIPYIAQLLDTRLVLGLDAAGQRLDVANTIDYRRRKGTLGVLEQIASDITQWDAKVVEFFRRLGRTRHLLDPPVGVIAAPGSDASRLQLAEGLLGTETSTMIGGFADLRNVYGATRSRSAFDEYFHTADTRAGLGLFGWQAIPHLGVFIWRLLSLAVGPVTPVAVENCPGWYCFDPTGRDVPLFAAQRTAAAFGDNGVNWVSPREDQLSTPITQQLLDAVLQMPVVSGSGQTGAVLVTQGWGRSLSSQPSVGDSFTIDGVYGTAPQASLTPSGLQVFIISAVSSDTAGEAALTIYPPITPSGHGQTVTASPANQAPITVVASTNLYPAVMSVLSVFGSPQPDTELVPAVYLKLRPARGRFAFFASPPLALVATYHYGFPSLIGAGPYDRRGQQIVVPTPAPAVTLTGGGAALAGGIAAAGTVVLGDSLTYDGAADVSIATALTLQAGNSQRPLVRLAEHTPWVITGTAEGASLALDGMFVSGADIVLSGTFAAVTLTCCTLDPGSAASSGVSPATSPPATSPPADLFQRSADGRDLRPTRLWIEAAVTTLTVDRCVLGPIRTRCGGDVETTSISNSTIQGIRTSGLGPIEPDQVKDPTRLLRDLQLGLDPVSAMLRSLDPSIGVLLGPVATPPLDTPDTPAADLAPLLGQLNALAGRPSLYQAAAFAGIPLSAATSRLLAEAVSGQSAPGLNRLLLEDAYPLELADAALAFGDGTLNLSRCTVIGRIVAHRLEASECLLQDLAQVDDRQDGCVRFTAWASGSHLPRQYESVTVPQGAPMFTSTDFGQPGYAQLSQTADLQRLPQTAPSTAPQNTISAGAVDGSEMGAYARDKNPIRAQALLLKLQEYMPANLVPVIIDVT
jgi:hypothetical protein